MTLLAQSKADVSVAQAAPPLFELRGISKDFPG